MKFLCLCSILVLLLADQNASAQNREIDSLTELVARSKNDTNKVNALLQLSKSYLTSLPEEAIRQSKSAMELSKKLGYKEGQAFALKNIGMVYYNQTKYAETVDYWSRSYRIFDSLDDVVNEALMLNNIGAVYMNQGDDPRALEYYNKSLQLAKRSGDKHKIALALANIGVVYSNNDVTADKALGYYIEALQLSEELQDQNIIGGLQVNIGELYLKRNEYDSALHYFKASLQAYENTENIPYSLNDIGQTYTKKGNYVLARQYHKEAIAFAEKLNLQLDMVQSFLGLGDAYFKSKSYSDALDTYKKAESYAQKLGVKKELKDAYEGLTNTYAAIGNYADAFSYQQLYSEIKDTLYNLDVAQKVSKLQTNLEIQNKQGEIDMLTKDHALQNLELKRQKFARNTLGIGLLLAFVVAIVLFKLYKKVGRRTLQVRRSLEELKSTQAQLIQAEKMASLGLLTAGIGHEIQNPLNFVNNFSEVNTDLLMELKEGPLTKLNGTDRDEARDILENLTENMRRISHHGKRADAIIKGMLQHSRQNTGEVEETNINTLAEEYLDLCYNGLPPKAKSIKINITRDLDDEIEKIDLIPQDFGRVMLNLFTNAFYSVLEKKEQLGDSYLPAVLLTTRRRNAKIEIRVKDNGLGISETIKDKIFQPFFTTKPTGEGTGLGLSLSYDIIKAHGGELVVRTEEGKYAEFIITLPISVK